MGFGGMVWWYASSLFPPHATAVDLCNRDRNPGTDDVPSRTAPYNVTSRAKQQPNAAGVAIDRTQNAPFAPPPGIASPSPCRALARLALATVSQRVFKSGRLTTTDIQRSHLQSAVATLRLFLQYATSSIFLLLQWLTQLGSCGGKDTATQCFLAQISGKLPRTANRQQTCTALGLEFISISNFRKVCRFRLVTLVCQ